MTERIPTTTEAPHVDPETVAEIDSAEEAGPTTIEHPEYWKDAQERLGDLLDAHELRKKQKSQEAALATYDEPFVPEADEAPAPETNPTDDETRELPALDDTAELDTTDDEATPEKKERLKRTRGVLKAIGKWSVTSLEANGFIPIRGTWHKRNGGTAFIAKTYVWNKKRKAERLNGFLSPEASAQLNGEDESDDHEDESRLKRTSRKIGSAALTGTGLRAVGKGYKLYKEIKNVAK
jgi:hypothetical protein